MLSAAGSLTGGFCRPVRWPCSVLLHVHIAVVEHSCLVENPELHTHHSICCLYDSPVVFLSAGAIVCFLGGAWLTIYICFLGVWAGAKVDNWTNLTRGCDWELFRITGAQCWHLEPFTARLPLLAPGWFLCSVTRTSVTLRQQQP